MIKLRDVYEKVYRNMQFSFTQNGKEYTCRVINVTFDYSVKTFNKLYDKTYVKNGYTAREITFDDCSCIKDGELIAIQCGEPVENPLPQSILGKSFRLLEGKYVANANIPTEMSVAALRHDLYANGFICDGIHYIRFKRSSGSARVGKCLFIDERMYKRMHNYDLCGLSVKEGDKIDLAGFESYISLPSSSIIDTIELDPRSILLIDDFESVFRDHVVATSVKDGIVATEYTDVDISNSIWDGQSLIQTGAIGNYNKYGFVLLRNRFFKSACFNCDIRRFFADNGITDVSQLSGKTYAEKLDDIKIITTPSSIKYLKFGSFEQWLENVGSTFGIVKHEKPTHYMDGEMVQTHYQLINTLQLTPAEVDELLKPSLDYVYALRTNPSVLRYHIKFAKEETMKNEPLLSKNEIVYRLMGVNEKFTKTKQYAEFRNSITQSYISDLRKGKILVDGNYSTLCGNPMEMLYAAIGRFDGVSRIGKGNVFSTRFGAGETILGSRSPHITVANVWLTHNTYNEEIAKYFTVTDQIIYINSIEENVLQRLSGCDCPKGRVA